jgi:proline dehydrogenase
MEKLRQAIDLENTEKAFAYKSDSELTGSKWLFQMMQFGLLVRIGAKILPFLVKSGLPIKSLIKKTLFKQFVGGESLENTASVCQKLGQHHVQVILDYGVEGGEYDDEKYELATEEFIKVIQYASKNQNIPFISIKITGLGSTELLEKLNLTIGQASPGSIFRDFNKQLNELSTQEKKDWNNLLQRINRICSCAEEKGIGVMIDAEETWIQDAIDFIAHSMMKIHNRSRVIVYNTIQLYRSDRLSFLKLSHEDAISEKYLLGLKLVRGAYMEKEAKRAAKMGYSNPIQPDKSSTDNDFNEAIAYCMSNIENISIIVASHNEKSNLMAASILSERNQTHNHHHLHFSQLYGMSDNLTFNLADAGYNTSKYLPFGPIKEVIPYLMRRAQENSSISGQTGRELKLINMECNRRGI